MAKKQVGFKKDYNAAYNWLQRDLQGASREEKLTGYKEFYKQIAKAADQRLVNLERLAKKEGYKEVTQWAYKDAMREIRGMFGEDAKRFNRRIPDNLNSVYKDINRVLGFLNAPTSSVTGITEIYNKRANTVSEHYNINVTWSNVGDLFESVLYKKVAKKYGSKTALMAIGQIQKNKKQVLQALKNERPISVHMAEGETYTIKDSRGNVETISGNVVEETANLFLRYYKKDVSKLVKRL